MKSILADFSPSLEVERKVCLFFDTGYCDDFTKKY
jgi:hypothetical protein